MVVTDSQLITAHCPSSGQPGGAGTGGTERGQHRCTGAGGHGRRRLWGRSYQADLRRCGELVARVPGRPDRKHFPKDDFRHRPGRGQLHLSGGTTHTIVPAGKRTDAAGRVHRLQAFQFDGAECRTCPPAVPVHRSQGQEGTAGADPSPGRPPAGGRALQQSPPTTNIDSRGVAVEHRLARLVQFGLRQSSLFRQGQ